VDTAEGSEIARFMLAYLVNSYPSASQTFIRREIAAIEAEGVPVRRYAVRSWDTELVDPEDIAEAGKTRKILDAGLPRVILAMVATALTRSGRFARALASAWRLGGASDRGRLVHLVYLAEACLLRRWLEREGVDHLHAHFGTNATAVALLCRLLGGPRYSFTVHGPEEFDQPLALSLGEKIKHAAFVVAICSFGRSQLWRWAAFEDWKKIHVVHCGLDPRYINAPASPPSTAPRLINIGRLVEQKGQLILVEASAILRDRGRDFEVIIIGGGSYREALEGRISELGLGDRVKLVGWKTGEEVKHELIGSRGLVLPSFGEGLPVVIMESLALRRPVISTYIAGIPELVRDGETGWLVPAGDVEKLAEAMIKLLDAPPEQLERMGEAGARAVALEHDVRIEARKLLGLINAAALSGQRSAVSGQQFGLR
jgi:colanic acid/amylovoran biosynthesis glycosyltransferase